MRLGAVGDLVAHARRKDEAAPIRKLGVQFAFQAQQDMALAAPVVGQITRGLLDRAHADGAELAGAPVSAAGFAGVYAGFDGGPVSSAEGEVVDVHV